MANTNRVRQIYQVAALFAGPSPATGQHFSSGNSGENYILQIPRVQSVSTDTNVTRQDVNVFGQLSRIDSIILEPPTASMDFSYYLLDGKAESILGFAASGESTFISGLIDKSQDEKNYFVAITPEGSDAVGYSNSNLTNVLALGNGFISNYSLSLAVGQIPTASVTVEAGNAVYYTGSSGKAIPAVNPENGQRIAGFNFSLPPAVSYTGSSIASALRPGDLIFELPRDGFLGSYASGLGAFHVQSVNISIPLSREPINRLGSTFPFAREPQFPINISMTIEAIAADIRESSLDDILCNDVSISPRLKLRLPDCEGNGANAVTLDFKNAKSDSSNYSLDLSSNATVSFTLSAQIGGIGNTTDGFFMSGSYT